MSLRLRDSMLFFVFHQPSSSDRPEASFQSERETMSGSLLCLYLCGYMDMWLAPFTSQTICQNMDDQTYKSLNLLRKNCFFESKIKKSFAPITAVSDKDRLSYSGVKAVML